MGAEKHAIAEREDAFARKAATEGWKCAVCNMTPIYDEREIFFRTKMCGYHAHVAAKDES